MANNRLSDHCRPILAEISANVCKTYYASGSPLVKSNYAIFIHDNVRGYIALVIRYAIQKCEWKPSCRLLYSPDIAVYDIFLSLYNILCRNSFAKNTHLRQILRDFLAFKSPNPKQNEYLKIRCQNVLNTDINYFENWMPVTHLAKYFFSISKTTRTFLFNFYSIRIRFPIIVMNCLWELLIIHCYFHFPGSIISNRCESKV